MSARTPTLLAPRRHGGDVVSITKRDGVVRALIFDFDGLILDTEVPIYEAWRDVYADHGHKLTIEKWSICVGSGENVLDPCTDLSNLTGSAVDCRALRARTREMVDQILASSRPMPGVVELIEAARARGVLLAIASSSPAAWVKGHVARLGIEDRFDCIRTSDDVERTKPAPDLFLAALACLGVDPSESLVLEDSPNGIRAAAAAGIPCIAVPNRITGGLDLSGASRILNSLTEFETDWLDNSGVPRQC